MEITQNEKIAKALMTLRPKAVWTLLGDDYSNIEWSDTKQTKPSWAEVEAEMANPTPTPEATVSDKLAYVGLSIDDLKAALGV